MAQLDVNKDNNKKYKIEVIYNSAVYAIKLEGYLHGLYYVISYKNYFVEKNT